MLGAASKETERSTVGKPKATIFVDTATAMAQVSNVARRAAIRPDA
jgi:hypothetical protein